MNYSVGNYKYSIPKPFKNLNEAVSYIQNVHPELTKEVIERMITPKIKEDGNDKSSGVPQETAESRKGTSKTNKGGSEQAGNPESK